MAMQQAPDGESARGRALVLWLLVLPCLCAAPVQADWHCQPFAAGPGPEDFEIYRYPHGETRLLISSARREAFFAPPAGSIRSALLHPQGGIGHPRVVRLVDAHDRPWAGRDEFNPLGLSLLVNRDKDADLLYVVNIGGDANAVEVFEIDRTDPQRLIWRRTLRDVLLDRPNDLVALPDGRIYVTNMFSPDNSVVMFDGAGKGDQQWHRTAAPAMKFANGIAASKTGDRLYIADFHSRRLFTVNRDTQDGGLGPDSCSLVLDAHPDNLTWADEVHRVLYIAAHTSYVRSALHLFLGSRAPSRILELDTAHLGIPADARGGICHSTGRRPVVDALPLAALGDINAASTAVRIDDRIIVSQLKDSRIFVCRRNKD